MRIGGYVPCSLSDFPGRIAAVVFTQGCNWRCPWCHNHALVYPEKFTAPLDASVILDRLAQRRGKLDGIVISGGEPTIHADLDVFLQEIKTLGFQTKLDTNGSNPDILHRLLEARLLDFIAMDIKASWDRYEVAAGVPVKIEALRKSVLLIRNSGIEYQLRTTRWPGLNDSDRDFIRDLVQDSPHVWQDYRIMTSTGKLAALASE